MSEKTTTQAPVFKKGTLFTHGTSSDPYWNPQPGQTWNNDAPQAECVVTAIRHLSDGDTLVYWAYAKDWNPGVRSSYKARATYLLAQGCRIHS